MALWKEKEREMQYSQYRASIELQRDTYLCFTDYEKAFDRVKLGDLLDISKGMRVNGKDLRIVHKAYWNQKVAVRVGTHQSDWMDKKSKTGVCSISRSILSMQ